MSQGIFDQSISYFLLSAAVQAVHMQCNVLFLLYCCAKVFSWPLHSFILDVSEQILKQRNIIFYNRIIFILLALSLVVRGPGCGPHDAPHNRQMLSESTTQI